MHFSSRMAFWRLNIHLFAVCCTVLRGVLAEWKKRQSTESKMTIGMIAGLGFIAGLATILITVWCCCCGSGCKNDLLKVVPMDKQETETVTRSTSSGSKGPETKRLERNESTESN